MTPITREIAKRIATTRYEDLPAEVTGYSKTLAMSALGAMVAGPECVGSDIVTRYVRRAGGTPEATDLGRGQKTSVEAAALANATYAHATEYEDDSFPEAVSSYTLFPAIFALGEHLHSDGRAVVEAFVLAYETQARIGLACREARRLGYMVLCLAGSIGCAAAGAKLLKLDERATTNALSIAASQGSGLGYQTGSMAHIVEMGFAARNGLTAALLAADGFTGQPDILEAPRGLFNIITAGKAENVDGIVSDWGRPYRVLEVGIKQYPCCYHLQRIIESTVALRDAGMLTVDNIEDVQVEVNAFFPTVVQHPEPHDEIQAQFSLPHAVAAAMLEPRVLPSSFSRAKIEAPEFKRLRAKVRMLVREDWGWTPTGWTPRIAYRLRDGSVLVEEPKRSKGQPPELLGFDACVEKYRGCVDKVLAEKKIAASVDILRSLESCDDVAKLMQAVSI
ncbi:MAG: MmgE/PrpD family protein [Candidatus Binataceae bacterium]|nr:MmgE/PrpD family protein [Candidatus Binataceae bacterium]